MPNQIHAEGSGIGLSLASECVTIMGGSLDVRSELGRGSTFTCTFSLGRAHLHDQTVIDEPLGPDEVPYLPTSSRWKVPEPDKVEEETAEVTTTSASTDTFSSQPSLLNLKASRIVLADDNADVRARGLGAMLMRGRCAVTSVVYCRPRFRSASSPTVRPRSTPCSPIRPI